MRIESKRTSFLLNLWALVLVACVAFGQTAAADPPMPEHVPDEVIIKFIEGADELSKKEIRDALKGAGIRGWGRIKAELRRIEGMSVEEAIARYGDNPVVEYIEPNFIVHAEQLPNDPSFSQLWGLQNTGQTGGTPGADISAVQAWDVFTGSSQVVIGVIDTGVDYNHPDLAANMWVNPGEIAGNGIDDDGNGFVDDVHGWDFRNNDNDPMDDHSHGTHVAGTIGGVGDNGTGVVGVSWNVSIMALKFLSGSGSGTTADAVDAVEYATSMGVHLTNNSWGGGGYSQALSDAIAAADAAGILFVAAAGNDGRNNDSSPHYPSSYDLDNIVSVAATDHNDQLASFSNYGVVSVDIAAPGVNTYSTTPGGAYGTKSGTSMATPHVAGALGLVFGRYPGIGHLDARDRIYVMADPIPALGGRMTTGARLNAFLAVAEQDTNPPGSIADLVASDRGSNWLVVDWTATGDDGPTGTASRYEVRYSTAPIDASNFDLAAQAPAPPDPGPAGTPESMAIEGLDAATTYFVAVKAFDEFGNASPISNVIAADTLDAPDVAVAPPTLTETLLSGATSVQTLTLSNLVVNSTLDFDVPTPALISSPVSQAEHLVLGKDDVDPRAGAPVIQGSGGPDQFGYRWVDSDDPFGPAYDWVDIAPTGAIAISSGDDVVTLPLPIGFAFPYYGADYTTVRVSSNGIVSFTDGSASYSNQPLPNPSAPRTMIAPFWDDLIVGSGDVYYQSDGSRFIVQWENVLHYGSGGPYTFQLILHRDGSIVFQYDSMGSPQTSATIGMQNATASDALQIAFNTTYVHDQLAVRIASVPQWLTATPPSGTIVGASSTTIDVAFDATGLLGGVYDGSVVIRTNDPDEPEVTVPTTLTVIGAPDIEIDPAAHDFGALFSGGTATTTFVVDNPGTDALDVTGVVFTDPAYSADATSFSIPPRGSRTLTVTFAPTAIRPHPATMTVHSNDPDEPSVVVVLSGQGIEAPDVRITPGSLSSSLLTGETETQLVTIHNDGGSDLVWSVSSQPVTQTFALPEIQQPAQQPGPDGGVVTPTGTEIAALEHVLADLSGVRILWDLSHGQTTQAGWSTIIADLTLRGATVSINTSPITPAVLAQYDVLWLVDTTLTWSASEIAALDAWLNLGGSLILEADQSISAFNGILTAVGAGIQFSTPSVSSGTSTNVYPHPITDGVSAVAFTSPLARLSTVTAPAERIADDRFGVPGMAVSQVGPGRIFAASDEIFHNSPVGTADNRLLGNQLFDWLAGGQFLTVAPASGVVPAGSNTTVDVLFDATGLFGGDYASTLRFQTNDPVQPTIDVRADLHVTGAPDIDVDPLSLDFGDLFVGQTDTLAITIANTGTDDLNVTSFLLASSDFKLDQTGAVPPFTVPHSSQTEMRVVFDPQAAGAKTATLALLNDDADEPSVSVQLAGDALDPPIASVTPSALSSSLLTGETETQTVTIRNDGGSDLVWSASLEPVTQTWVLPEIQEPAPHVGADGELVTATEFDTAALQHVLADLTGVRILWDLSHGQVSQAGWSTIIADLTARGATVTINTSPITQAVLAQYDVLWLVDNTFTWTSAELAALDAWVNLGGSVIFEGDQSSAAFNGILTSLGAGIQFSSPSVSSGTSTNVYPHPITDGVSAVAFTSPLARLSIVTAPAERIADDRLGVPGMAVSQVGAGRIFAASDEIFHNSPVGTADNRLLGNQLIDWMAGQRMLSIDPASGVLPAGSSIDADVLFDATGLFGGDYVSIIRFETNDPATSQIDVRADLHVTGVPDIDVSPRVHDFGHLLVGESSTLSVTIANTGTDDLEVTGFLMMHPDFSLDPAGAIPPFTVPHSSQTEMLVRYAPVAPGSPGVGLFVFSDDPDESQVIVQLFGVSENPPIASVTPGSLSSSLLTGETETQSLTIRNDGPSDLVWSASSEAVTQSYVLTAPTVPVGPDDDGAVVAESEVRTTPIESVLADLTGVKILWDASHGQGFHSGWSTIIADLTARGATVTINSAFITPAVLAGYDVLWSKDSASTWTSSQLAALDGWVKTGGSLILEGDNTSTVSAFNSILGTLGAGITLTAISGAAGVSSNIHPHPTTNGVSSVYFSGNVAHISSVTSPAVRVVDDRLGTAAAAASEVGAGRVFVVTDEAFGNGHVGVADNQLLGNQVFDWLATGHVGGRFLSFFPGSGIVPAGSSADVDVFFDATGLFGGDYASVIRFETNDPLHPTIDVRADLHVTGVPVMVVAPSSLDFGAFFIGLSEQLEVTVSNVGTDDLDVTSIAFSNAAYSADLASFTIPPFGEQTVVVTFAPTIAGRAAAVMTVHSNDPTNPNQTVNATGVGIEPPIAAITPSALFSDLYTNEIETQTLTVQNQGGSVLEWSVSQRPVTQTYSLAALALPEPQVGPDGDVVTPAEFETAPLESVLADLSGVRILWDLSHSQYHRSSSHSSIIADLTQRGATVTEISAPLTPGVLAQFDVVWSVESRVSWTSAELTALADWLSRGGGLILEGDESPEIFNTILDGVGSGIEYSSLNATSGTSTNVYPHEITDGVSSYYLSGPLARLSTITAPAQRIADDRFGVPTVAVERLAAGRVFAVSDEIFFDITVGSAQNRLLGNQVFDWLAGHRYLTIDPVAGTLAPGGSATVDVTFDATGLFGGDYDSILRFQTNDPFREQVDVPANLHVTGIPIVEITPTVLDFGVIYIGYPESLSFVVENTGTEILTVSAISAPLPDYTTDVPTFDLAPSESRELVVTFDPTVDGDRSTTLELESNALDSPHAISLIGAALIPPEIEISPVPIEAAALPGGQKTKTLEVCNDGGSDLAFDVSWANDPASRAQPHALLDLPKELDVEGVATVDDPRPGILGSGGPDAYGYTWIDSDQPGGPTYDWVDITGVGTPIALGSYTDDANAGPIPIGFTFPFYGQTFNAVHVTTNGWLSFTNDTSTAHTNQPLPSPESPENLLAPWWDDLIYQPGLGHEIWTYNDGSRFIVEFFLRRVGDTTPPFNRFQVVLYPDGDIVYQYHTLDTITFGSTIGIQNATGDDGLTVAFNHLHAHDGMAIEFSVESTPWLYVSPSTGVLPPGACTDLSVDLNAAELAAGDHEGEIIIASNDPATPTIADPVIFHVGSVDIAADVDPDTNNRDANGNWITAYIELPLEYDVDDVLVETVRFNMTVPPDRMQIGDFNGNGIPDLTFKFRRSAANEVLPTAEQVPVMVTGEIRDTIYFKAEDVIRVIGPPTVTHPVYGIMIDSDGDGVADLFETGTGVYASPEDTGTDPDFWDTDGDGFSDGDELAAGSDPNDPASVPVIAVPGVVGAGLWLVAGLMLATGFALARRGTRIAG